MKPNKNKQIMIGALMTYLSIGINVAAGILYTPWMISQIGQSDYGLYTLANSLISLFLVDIGLGAATSRFVAKYRAQGRENEIPGFLSAVYKLYLGLDAIIFLALIGVFFCTDLIYSNFSATELTKFKTIFCIAGLYSLVSFPCTTFNGILTAYEEFVPLKLADVVQRIGTIALTVIALLLGMKLYALVTVNAICGLLSIGIKFWFVQKNIPIRFSKNQRSTYREILGFSVWSSVYGLAQRLIFNITPTIIGMTVAAATSAIAVFGIVTTIESYCYTITTAINGMFISRITRFAEGDHSRSRITALATKVGRFQFGLNGLVILGFLTVGREFIDLWIGDAYRAAYWGILLVITPGLFYNSLQIFNTAIVAQNLVKYQAYIQITMGLCNVTLSLLFSSLWGVVGASLSIFVAYSLRVILTLILIQKKLDVDLSHYIRNCYGRMAIPLALSLVICVGVCGFIPAGNWGMLVLKACTVATVYGICLVLLGLTADERKKLLRK